MALTTGNTRGGVLPTRSVQPYPTTPPPLSAGDIASFDARRRGVSRNLKTALARRTAGTAQTNASFEQFVSRLGRERKRNTRDTMQVLGGRGTARDPRFGGQALVRIRDEFADRRAEADSGRAQQLAALDQMVNEARTTRDDELTAISSDKARRRTALDQLIRQVGA